ncbi:unnamed protein product [Rotaria sordida]|uniref:Uncharacterized protein n=1 Tax=Rotaria sordida TaxID=392033 RepID=A0A814SR39_9BILA|nr:unnamed protein product [Rotaria sordida]
METIKQDTKDVTVGNNNELINTNNQQNSFALRFVKRASVYTGVICVVGMFGVPTALSWIGFTSMGVTVGSWAAWWQATHFVPGIFSLMQSVTATGAVGALFIKVGIGAALTKAFIDASKTSNETKPDNNEKVQSKLS